MRAGPAVYRLGTRLKVRAVKVDFEKRRIDVVLDGPERARTGGASGTDRGRMPRRTGRRR